MVGIDPTATIINATIMASFMFFGGLASGPARKASITTEKISVAAVEITHNKEDETDSGTGYETRFK